MSWGMSFFSAGAGGYDTRHDVGIWGLVEGSIYDMRSDLEEGGIS